MKKIFFSLLALVLPVCLLSQSNFIAKGKILDAFTKQPLQAASVFAENTTLGTATDSEGNFTLHLPNGGYNLVVTFTGYQTETKRITSGEEGNNSILVELKQKEKELQDVVIKASFEVKDGWEKYGDFFLENFIGKTINSRSCSIVNKEVLHFFYYKRKNLLKITAEAPVEIINDALGYSIKYTLDSFIHEYNTQVNVYTGYPLFKELEPANEDQRSRWQANRMAAYQGSILHFMRSMYRKKLKEEGFEIQFLLKENDKEKAIPLKNFYAAVNYNLDDTAGSVAIRPNQKEVAVLYKNEEPSKLFIETNPDASPKFQLSVVSFLPNEFLEIEQNGYYYEQNDITITGYWAWEKVADMLPYNFMDASVQENNSVNAAPLLVKPAPEQNKPADFLTSTNWKAEESRIMEGNHVSYYKRGGLENSQFNAGNTGAWLFNGQDYKFTWQYANAEKTKIKMIMQYPTPLVVTLENIVISATIFSYTRLQQANGVNLMAIETRTVK
jgi:hypothetical protein